MVTYKIENVFTYSISTEFNRNQRDLKIMKILTDERPEENSALLSV